MAPNMMRMTPKAASWVNTPNATPRPPASSAIARKMVKVLLISILLERAVGFFRWL